MQGTANETSRKRTRTDPGIGASSPAPDGAPCTLLEALSRLGLAIDAAAVPYPASHSADLLSGLRDEVLHGSACGNVTLCLDDGLCVTFPRWMLMRFSAYFQGMFSSSMLERAAVLISVREVESQPFVSILLSLIYSGLVVDESNCADLLVMSDRLDVPLAKKACCDFIADHVTVESCLDLWALADVPGCDELSRHICSVAARWFGPVRSTREYLTLPEDKVLSLLQHPELAASTEEVFASAMAWVQHSPASRLSLRPSLYEAVCLPLLPSALLAGLQASAATGGGSAIEAAVDLQQDRSRRMELCRMRHERSRRGDKVAVVVSFIYRRIYQVDPTSLTASAVVGAEPLNGTDYAVATYGGLVVTAGGSENGAWTAAVRCFDPKLPYWSELPPLPGARYAACAAVLDGCLFVCGGYNANHQLEARVDRFSFLHQVWSPVAPLPSPRWDARAVVQDGQLYVIGGHRNDGNVNEIVCYDAVTDTWAVVGTLSQARNTCGVAVDSNGGIFVVGGHSSQGFSNVVERSDTRSRQLSVLPPLPQGRYSSAVLVQDGVLHVFGGAGPNGRMASRLSLPLAPTASVPAAWTETANALPEPDWFAGMLAGV